MLLYFESFPVVENIFLAYKLIFAFIMSVVSRYLLLRCMILRIKQIFFLSPALAGTRRACRAGEKSHLRVYTRDKFLPIFKSHKFST